MSSISNSFWDVETSGQTQSDGGFGRTTAQMKQSSTYNGWGDSIWTIEESVDYPHLTWEGAGGDVIDNIPDRSYSGSGTETEPFVITTAGDLCCLSGRQEDWDQWFELANDIDMSAITGYLPPGDFTGRFNGNGYRISNLTVNEPGSFLLGLFGYLGKGSEINNLGLVDVEITGYSYLGILMGYNYNGSISNCYATGSVSGDNHFGGLVGYNKSGSISNCYATGSVSGNDSLGGLVGENDYGSISYSYATGSVSGDDYLGGLVGVNYGSISKCYAIGSVSGGDYSYRLGGLVGYHLQRLISNCYSTGSVTGGDNSSSLGGLVGYNKYGNISNCYATGSVNGDTYLGGLVGYKQEGSTGHSFWDLETGGPDNGIGTPKTTEEMQTQNTFTNAGWNFVGEDPNDTDNIWRMCVDGIDYPKLSWQFLPGDFACPDSVEINDLMYMLEYWLDDDCPGTPGCSIADINADNEINLKDFTHLAANWLAY